MKLTGNHIASLRSQKQDAFVEDMAILIRDKDPFHAEALGLDGVRSVIRHGIVFAAEDGIDQRDPVRVYIQLMFFLGSRFTKDPMMPWAHAVLNPDRPYGSQASRMSDLRNAAITYLQETCGSDGLPLRSFLATCRDAAQSSASDMTADGCNTFLKENYPLKYEAVGAQMVGSLISDSQMLCANAHFRRDASAVYLTCLRFVYGYWLLKDPLFPWIGKLFEEGEDHTGKDKDAIFEKLVLRFMDKIQEHISARETAHVG